MRHGFVDTTVFYDRRIEHVLAQITVAREQKRLKETMVWSPIAIF